MSQETLLSKQKIETAFKRFDKVGESVNPLKLIVM